MAADVNEADAALGDQAAGNRSVVPSTSAAWATASSRSGCSLLRLTMAGHGSYSLDHAVVLPIGHEPGWFSCRPARNRPGEAGIRAVYRDNRQPALSGSLPASFKQPFASLRSLTLRGVGRPRPAIIAAARRLVRAAAGYVWRPLNALYKRAVTRSNRCVYGYRFKAAHRAARAGLCRWWCGRAAGRCRPGRGRRGWPARCGTGGPVMGRGWRPGCGRAGPCRW